MKSYLKKISALVLAVMLAFGSASAFSLNVINTKFEYVLWQIEENSLFTQDKEMPQSEIDHWNAYLEEHPEEFDTVINNYLKTLDTHSMYLSEQDYNDGFSTIAGYTGIGVSMCQTPEGAKITKVNRSGPAYTAGIQIDDRIVGIDGTDVTDKTSSEISALIRGEAGTDVSITVERNGQRLSFTLTRQHIQEEYVSSQTVADGVEYIRVEAMGSDNDLEDFLEIWYGLDEKNTRAVILDLRSNGGGLVDEYWC